MAFKYNKKYFLFIYQSNKEINSCLEIFMFIIYGLSMHSRLILSIALMFGNKIKLFGITVCTLGWIATITSNRLSDSAV